MTQRAQRTQAIVGLGSVFGVVLGPLTMVWPLFAFEPHGWAPWLKSLGLGLVAVLPLIAWLAWLTRRGLLDLFQAVFASVFLGFAVTTVAATLLLAYNALADPDPPEVYRATIAAVDVREAYSTTDPNRVRHYAKRVLVDLVLHEAPKKELRRVEVEEGGLVPEQGNERNVQVRHGALGWWWDVTLLEPRDPDDDSR